MGLKTRHIDQNIKQIKKYMQKETQTPRIQWEKNNTIIRNPNISQEDVFCKRTTDLFPDGASVRMNNQSRGYATVYFKSPIKTRTYGSGNNAQSYNYCDETLKVTLPMTSSWNSQTYTYSFTGQLPKQFTLNEMNAVLKFVRGQIKEMTGNCLNIKDDEN